MCNEIKCAVQENVQIGCTGDVHIAAVGWWGIMDVLQFIKLSPVDVMMLWAWV